MTTSTFRERWQGEATSLYISCMMTIGVLRMQTALLARLIMERRCRCRRNMDNLIQTTNMLLHFATAPQRSRQTVLMRSRHKVFWVVHRVVCLFLPGRLPAATIYSIFQLQCHDLGGREGGRAAGSQAFARRRVQFIVQFTVYKHPMSQLSTNSDRVISGCRSDRSRTAIIRTKVFT